MSQNLPHPSELVYDALDLRTGVPKEIVFYEGEWQSFKLYIKRNAAGIVSIALAASSGAHITTRGPSEDSPYYARYAPAPAGVDCGFDDCDRPALYCELHSLSIETPTDDA